MGRASTAGSRRGSWRRIKRVLLVGLGAFLVVLGALTFPLPLPVGLPLAVLGLALVVRNSRAGKRWLVALAARHPRLRGALTRVRRSRRREAIQQASD